MNGAMQPEDLFEAARARARALEVPRPPEAAALERLRTECAAWFDKVPEPPLYRRLDDPARKTAEGLIPEGEELLARALATARHERTRPVTEPIIAALEAHLEVLCHTAEGRLEKAERAWHRALTLERQVGRQNRLWVRSDEAPRPVFDKQTRASRYDPGPEPTITVKLACPQRSCGAQERFKFSPRYSTHRFVCPRCKKSFLGYFGEVRAVERVRKPGLVHYVFKVEELGGALSQVEFEEGSGAEFPVARRDLMAFLYDEDRDLKAVLNLSSGRLLWVSRGGGCFVVTAVYGPMAEELRAFRAFRDRTLMESRVGRVAVSAYYAVGPAAAEVVRRRPWLRRVVRKMLGRVHQSLSRRGY